MSAEEESLQDCTEHLDGPDCNTLEDIPLKRLKRQKLKEKKLSGGPPKQYARVKYNVCAKDGSLISSYAIVDGNKRKDATTEQEDDAPTASNKSTCQKAALYLNHLLEKLIKRAEFPVIALDFYICIDSGAVRLKSSGGESACESKTVGNGDWIHVSHHDNSITIEPNVGGSWASATDIEKIMIYTLLRYHPMHRTGHSIDRVPYYYVIGSGEIYGGHYTLYIHPLTTPFTGGNLECPKIYDKVEAAAHDLAEKDSKFDGNAGISVDKGAREECDARGVTNIDGIKYEISMGNIECEAPVHMHSIATIRMVHCNSDTTSATRGAMSLGVCTNKYPPAGGDVMCSDSGSATMSARELLCYCRVQNQVSKVAILGIVSRWQKQGTKPIPVAGVPYRSSWAKERLSQNIENLRNSHSDVHGIVVPVGVDGDVCPDINTNCIIDYNAYRQLPERGGIPMQPSGTKGVEISLLSFTFDTVSRKQRHI